MAEPENHTLRILREVRAALEAMDAKFDGRFDGLESRFDDLRSRVDNIRQAAFGESVLGRYAAAEVEERLDSIEKRLGALEDAT